MKDINDERDPPPAGKNPFSGQGYKEHVKDNTGKYLIAVVVILVIIAAITN